MLLITPEYPPSVGGIQSLLHEITTAMPRASVKVMTPDAPGGAAFDAGAGVRTDRVRVVGSSSIVRNLVFNARGLTRLHDGRPDVVLNGHVVTAPLAWAFARRHRVPLVTYGYGKEIQGRPGLARWALRRGAAAIAISEFTRGLLLETVRGGRHAPVHVVHPGVHVPASVPARADDGPFTLITVGRLRDWYKGHDIVLEALPRVLERLPGARWVVLGDGRRRAALEERAAKLGVAHAVRFLGAVSDADKQAWLQQADVFVMPARYPKGEVAGEGFAIVYLEAAAWGVPSIAGDVGGPREAVVDGVTGLLVDPESAEQVADAILALGLDPARARELGAQARERAERDFTWPHVAAQLEAILRAVCERSARS
ncbi:glycosyltransferase family 4 protein [Agrococcus beijingensis]|uniref:glycosyltransferase family 4 protein n=1 Tax=Agrococcus beijingensis TaxID=3068634 RepID=UPI002741A852|nr:glycosyltransferase family 4 protein [Agrococcus sp. REN33]